MGQKAVVVAFGLTGVAFVLVALSLWCPMFFYKEAEYGTGNIIDKNVYVLWTVAESQNLYARLAAQFNFNRVEDAFNKIQEMIPELQGYRRCYSPKEDTLCFWIYNLELRSAEDLWKFTGFSGSEKDDTTPMIIFCLTCPAFLCYLIVLGLLIFLVFALYHYAYVEASLTSRRSAQFAMVN